MYDAKDPEAVSPKTEQLRPPEGRVVLSGAVEGDTLATRGTGGLQTIPGT